MLRLFFVLLLSVISLTAFAQKPQFEFDGQFSTIGNYSPNNRLNIFIGERYIPELNIGFHLDSTKTLDIEASANIAMSMHFHPFDTMGHNSSITPYRGWIRYNTPQFELRVGLQKIDFGAATLLRPIQWFNQIDPRDPLQLTNGVYGILGRYYFLNNANIWVWGLYGNQKTRGFDVVETNIRIPEFGGRFQYPVPKGELGIAYHFRVANSENLVFVPQFSHIPEHRIGIDGKWDLGVGLWFEAAYVHKTKILDFLTNQAQFNVGMDYTLGVGNGLNMGMEHLISTLDQRAFAFENQAQITAITANYPLGFFDNISAAAYYNWTAKNTTFFINYSHQFQALQTYFILYYNPDVQQGILQNGLSNQFSGMGFRVMFVYNH